MINITYEDIVSKIKENSNLSDADIDGKVKDKLKQLSGLISKEGAAHIIANELGVKVVDAVSGKVKIKDLRSGMRSVEVFGKVVRKFELREFEKADRKGKVANFMIGDETGTVRVVLWNDLTDKFTLFNEGDILRIANAYARDNNDKTEIHLNSQSILTVNPEGVTITVSSFERISPVSGARKSIGELTEDDNNVELLATVVQVYDPKFFEVCPQCSKRAKGSPDTGYTCDQHGQVTPKFGFVLNLHLDDSTGNIRSVLWRKQVLDLVKMPEEEFMKFKESPFEFEQKKTELLGNIVRVVGRVNKNQTFNNSEFVVNFVDTNPDPKAEMKKLEQNAGKGAAKPAGKQALHEDEELSVEKEDLFSIDEM